MCLHCSASRFEFPDTLNYVEEHGPKIGKEIAKALPIYVSTLTRHTVPKLKSYGLRNKRGAGYYIDKD